MPEVSGPKTCWVEVNGAALRVSTRGTWGQATPIVLIHEAGGSIESWEAVAERLALTHPVLIYDQRGFGMSERAPKLTIRSIVDDLVGILDAFDIDRAHLAGPAFGGAIALMLAAAHPGRVASVVSPSPLFGNIPEAQAEGYRARADDVAQNGMRVISDLVLSKSYPEDLRGSEFDQVRLRHLANDPHSFAAASRTFGTINIGAVAKDITALTLLIGCTRDPVRSCKEVRAFAERLPCGDYAELETGHFSASISPGPLADLILGFVEKANA